MIILRSCIIINKTLNRSQLIESGKNLQKAKKWIAKAIEIDGGKYWMFRQQALILAKLDEKEAAILASKNSLKLAKEAGNQDYIRLNNISIAEWSK